MMTMTPLTIWTPPITTNTTTPLPPMPMPMLLTNSVMMTATTDWDQCHDTDYQHKYQH